MRIAYEIFANLLLGYTAIVYPFMQGVRDRGVVFTFFIGWLMCFVSALLLCFGIPMLVNVVNPDVTRDMIVHWVLDMPAVFAVAVVGWIPVTLSMTAGLLTRGLYVLVTRRRQGRKTSGGNDNPQVA